MEKRLSRTDLMFTLGFLLMLVVAVGAFFYGVKVGSDQADAKYLTANKKPGTTAPVTQNAYAQQDLVSFYHTVFLPHREWTSEWSADQQRWLSDNTTDRAAAMSDLSKLATSKYNEAQTTAVSSVSPFLSEAQTHYLKSLKLLSSSFSKLASSANTGTAADLLKKIESDAYYTEALKEQLQGQKFYYASMLKWGATVELDLPDQYETPKVLPNASWTKLPLLVKNKISADYMNLNRDSYDFLPQDLTARIDQFIASGQAGKMKQNSVFPIAEVLIGTDAVRTGDFLSLKSMLYSKQLLPQLPFFSTDK